MAAPVIVLPRDGAAPPRLAVRRAPQARATLPNAVVGTLIFLGAEAMFFAGLVSAFLVLRAGTPEWPPANQPRLPVAMTALNTIVLLASGYTMRRAVRAIRSDRTGELLHWVTATVLLGAAFLVVQGSEWIRLVHYGLHVTSGMYGGTFYTVIGCHGVHVLVGLLLLLNVWWGARRERYSARAHVGVEACRLYWTFVVGVWPVLYLLVYLA